MSEIFGNSIMGGGGLTNSKLALADAQPEDVRGGKKFYSGDKQIKTGTLSDVTQATPAITVDAVGKITASATQAAGVVAAGTKSATKQLTLQAGGTVTPRISTQTAVASQRFTTGDVKVAAVNGIIRVTYPAGDTCTCKNGNTTLTANASDGITVFLVPNTGTWTLTVTNGTKTATKTVSITATSRFANVTLAYFSATISITYPAASTCVVTDSSGTQIASDTNGDSSAKTWTVTVGSTGTYTITATSADGTKTKSSSVTITTDGQSESVEMAYEFEVYNAGTFSIASGSTKFDAKNADDTGTSSLTKNSTSMLWECGQSTWCMFYLTPKISFAGYSTLKISVTNASMVIDTDAAGKGKWGLVSASTVDDRLLETPDFIAKTTFTKFSESKTLSVDISNVKSGEYYIAMHFGTPGEIGTFSARVTKIWLEK